MCLTVQCASYLACGFLPAAGAPAHPKVTLYMGADKHESEPEGRVWKEEDVGGKEVWREVVCVNGFVLERRVCVWGVCESGCVGEKGGCVTS